jgi:hypothetical protein
MRGLLITGITVTFAVAAQAQSAYRTPWGDPDLQGIWSNATPTPLERPAALAGKLFWTEAEAAEVEKNGLQQVLKTFAAEVPFTGELNETYLEPGKVVRSRRTSQVVDPPDGRIPYTPEGKRRWDAVPTATRSEAVGVRLETNSWEDRTLGERCIGAGVAVLPNPFYNNNHQIFQSPGYVAILSEMMHTFRIIPLKLGRTAASQIGSPPQWAGNSRGQWEGQTLVVETRNFNDKQLFRGATTALRFVERFTRVDATMIDYQLTVTDPATFTQPWTVVNTLRMTPGLIYEYACHEDNYGLVGILAGARAEKKGR